MKNSNAFQRKTELRSVFLFVSKCLNVALMALPFSLSWHWFYAEKIVAPFFLKGNLTLIGLYAFLYALLAHLYKGYAIPFSRVSELVYSQSLAAVLSDFVLFIVTALLARRYVSVWPSLLALGSQVIISALWSFFTHKLYFSVHPPLRAVFIRDENEHGNLSKELKKAEDRFQLIEEISIAEYLREPERYLEEAEAVFLTDTRHRGRDKVIKDCVSADISLYLLPSISDALIFGARPSHLFYRPLVEITSYNPSPPYLFVKRCMDIFISLLALSILWPLMTVVALLIRRDGGPIFYRQARLTKGGKVFQVIKFRSMTVNAESDGIARLSSGQNDSRVTPIGRVIRRLRIDELPQLLNILRGDMSIVGPRPERPELAAEYEKTLPEFSFRLRAKAGLTGYAQVYGKYNTMPYEKLLMDLQYMAHAGLLTDLKIIFATVKVLFIPESTDGVEIQKDASVF